MAGNAKRRLSLITAGSIMLLLMLGVVVPLRYGPGTNSARSNEVRVHVVMANRDATSVHYVWQVSGSRTWKSFNSQTNGPGSAITLDTDGDLLGKLYGSGSDTINYELTVYLQNKIAPGQTSYSMAVEMVGNHGGPMSGRTGSFSSAANSIGKLVVVLVNKDTIIKVPGRVVFATFDGHPLILEF